jgi:hypothetical protein
MIREEEYKKEEKMVDDCKDKLVEEEAKEKELLHAREHEMA